MARIIHLFGNGRVDVFPFELKDFEKMKDLCLMYRDRYEPGTIDYYRWYRNYMLLIMGCNTGCRIEVLLQLTPIYLNGSKTRIKEFKTKKISHFNANPKVYKEIEEYIKYTKIGKRDFFFTAKPFDLRPITRQQAYRIIKKLAKDAGVKYNVGCHSLRKSYGRFMYDETHDLPLVQGMLGHDKPQITLQYICLEEDKVAKAKEASAWGLDD